MSDLAVVSDNRANTLPALIDRAVAALASARTAAEVLEARDIAAIAYDLAKRTARLAKAKQAHDEVIAAAYRAQAHALEIDAQAKRRLADEYDAAQERGEVQPHGGQGKRDIPDENIPSVKDLGLSPRDVHEGRLIRDAETADPGIIERTINKAVAAGEEPTKAKVRRAVLRIVKPDAEQSSAQPPLGSPEQQQTRFLNIAWDAEHRPSEFDFPSMTNFSGLAEAAERVSKAWSAAAQELRRLAAS